MSLRILLTQQQEVCALAKELVDIVHSYGKEAMMFGRSLDRDGTMHGKYFAEIGLDAEGFCWQWCDTRMISDIKRVKYTEGRLCHIFSPDVFGEGGDPIGEAKDN